MVVMEGLHGSGKSTQVEYLQKTLSTEGFPVVVTKEVAGTKFADDIYKLAFEEGGEAFDDPVIMTLLLAASRASRVRKIIKPMLESGGVVIADRYESSMLVFQHYCQGVDETLVRDLNKRVTMGIHADVTFVLDIHPETAHSRRMRRLQAGESLTGWDKKDFDFHTRSREGYLKFAQIEPGWLILDGTKAEEEIADEIYNRVKELISQKNSK